MSRRRDRPDAPAPLKGFKTHLPVKPCAHCGRPMAWRRAWARCWDEVRHCSDACRAAARRARRADGVVLP